MNEFRLEEWERPPGSDVPLLAETDAIVQVTHEGELHEVHLRYVPHNEPPYSTIWRVFAFFPGLNTGNKILLRDSSDLFSLIPYYSPHYYGLERLSIELNERLIKGELTWGHYSHWGQERQFVMDSESQAWLAPSWGHCHRFKCSALDNCSVWSEARNIRNIVEAEWQNPISEVRFASDWCQLGDLGRDELLLGGSEFIQSIREVMTLVLQSEVGTASAWEVALSGKPEGRIYGEEQLIENKPPVLQKWQDFLQSRATSRFQYHLLKHECVQQFLRRVFAIPIVWLESAPTYHERLEARHQLREWLQHNAPERTDLLPE